MLVWIITKNLIKSAISFSFSPVQWWVYSHFVHIWTLIFSTFVKISGEEGTGRRMKALQWSLRDFYALRWQDFLKYLQYLQKWWLLSVTVVKGILTSQQKILSFSLWFFPPMSVCTHIKTHFKFIPVLHFQKEDLLSVSSCCSSVFKAPEYLFTSSANEYVETPSKPKESHLCKTGSNIAPIVFRSQMYTFSESQGREIFALNGCKRGHGNVCEILTFSLLFLTPLK